MKNRLLNGGVYEIFMEKNERMLRKKLEGKDTSQCIQLLHNYLRGIHSGLMIDNLEMIHMNYESCQTIMEIYYEKVEERKTEVAEELKNIANELYSENERRLDELNEFIARLD